MNTQTVLIPTGHPNRPGDNLTALVGGVVHWTANTDPTSDAIANRDYFARPYQNKNGIFYEVDGVTPFVYGSTQAICDQNGVVYAIPYYEVAWAVGDKELPYDPVYLGQTHLAHDIFTNRQNYQTVSWEICVNDDWEAACQVALQEIYQFLTARNLTPIFDFRQPNPEELLIVRHFDLTGKDCPHPFVSDSAAWQQFQDSLAGMFT